MFGFRNKLKREIKIFTMENVLRMKIDDDGVE
jgi:hypothetical protein